MKRYTLYIILFLFALLPCSAQKKYDAMWKEVEKHIKDDMPRKVIDTSRSIMLKAQKEGNFPQEMKAWVMMVNTLRELSPDSMKTVTPPQYKQSGANDAIVNTLLATSISNRDDSLREVYVSKILENKEALYKAKTDDFLPLITEGEDSRLFADDMLSLLTHFVTSKGGLSAEQRDSLLRDVASFYKDKGNKEAYTLLTLERYRLPRRPQKEQYTDSINTLLTVSKGLEANFDVAQKAYSCIDSKDIDRQIEFARWAIKEFPDKKEFFENLEEGLLLPTCQINSITDVKADVKSPIKLKFENLERATLEVRLYNGTDKKNKLKTDGKLILSKQYEFGKDSLNVARKAKQLPTRGEITDTLILPAEQYVFLLKDLGEPKTRRLNLTNLALFVTEIPGKGHVAYVLNTTTGLPVDGATVTAEFRSEKQKRTFTTDKDGIALLDLNHDKARNWRITAKTNDRNITNEVSFFRQDEPKTEPSNDIHAFIYPDRKIYRPGQTMNLAVVVYSQKEDVTEVYSKDSVEVTLSNFEGFEVKKKVMPNSLGTASCSFDIPKDIKPGQLECSVFDNSISIQVEEYKRPSFYLVEHKELIKDSLVSDNKDLTFSDTAKVWVRVMTYSGIPVQNAKVTFKTEVRTGKNFFRANMLAETLYDTLFTDAQGFVSLPIFINPGLEDKNEKLWSVRYRTSYCVTDPSGESHDGNYTFYVSRQGFELSFKPNARYINMADQEHTDITILATNADGNEVGEGMVKNPHYRLLDLDSVLVAEGSFVPNKPIILPEVPMGTYYLIASATDKSGNLIEKDMDLNIFSTDVKTIEKGELTKFEDVVCYAPKTEISETEPAVIYFSPTEKDVQVHYLVLSDDRLIKEEVFSADRKMYRLKTPYKKEYGNGFEVIVFYAKNGSSYVMEQDFTYRQPEKRLDLSWKTFRDKLTPGQKETWTLSVKTPDGKPVNSAGLVATMYDSSLELFARPWVSFYEQSLYFPRNFRRYNFNQSNSWNNLYLYNSKPYKSVSRDFTRSFSELSCYFNGPQSQIRIRGTRMNRDVYDVVETSHMELREVAVKAPTEEEYSGLDIYDGVTGMQLKGRIAGLDMVNSPEIEVGYQVGSPMNGSQEKTRIRTNFSEQGFFFPNLVTDKDGNVDISFTLPETLTEWKFYGMVHDKEINGGSITAKAVARQEFMIRPNMPRFLREGDKATISANIFNQTDRQTSGKATLRLIDPENNLTITVLDEPFTAAPDSSTTVTFSIPSLQGRVGDRLLTCEITASSPTFSDGERHSIIVLPAANSQQPTANSPKTTNLYDMVFDALEMMKVCKEDNTVSHAASLYANTKLKELSHTPLLTPNSSLLTATKSPTPDSLDYHISKSVKRLQELQYADGSWSWFTGMEGNYYITLLTCENLARLSHSPLFTLHSSLNKGMDYLDKHELDRYKDLKKMKHPSFYPSETTLHYLYILSLMPERTLSKEVKEMCNTYIKELEKMSADLSIWGKSNASIILRQNDRKKSADKFVESVMEYTVFKKGMGRYFDTRKAHYSWRDYRIPTQLAAIRAFDSTPNSPLLTPNSDWKSEMILWLLRQKQVQKWDNPANTVDVADLLLHASKDGVTPPDWSIVTDDSAFFAEGLKIKTKIEGKKEVGETVEMVITVTADRDMDFVKVTARHPACLEPTEQTSGYRWLGNGGGYVARHDSYTDLFFDTFRKGEHTFRLKFHVDRKGEYHSGTSSVTCTYCPDFTSNADSQLIKILK